MKAFFKTQKTSISLRGTPVRLRGVNLGGWLMMEGYILQSLNIAEQILRRNFVKVHGASEFKVFQKAFRDNFIQEDDLKEIAALGFNCVRVPFHFRLIEKSPYRYDREGLGYLDQVVRWGEKYHLGVILDLHAAPGCQNHDWHSDSMGEAEFWTQQSHQERTLALWEFLAKHFKDQPAVAGYDLLNESVIGDTTQLNAFYKKLIQTIRKADANHILFVEGNKWATDIACLENFNDDNIVLSIHAYEPIDFTFNFIPQLRYPLTSGPMQYGKADTRKLVMSYKKISAERQCPIFVGEFGINARDGFYGEDRWLRDMLACFEEARFHWTYWTYKAVKSGSFPDGIMSYLPNPPWVRRQGPCLGWDNYPQLWKNNKQAMVRSWRTENFTPNEEILRVLKETVGNRKIT